jgi:hypothetical protein
MNKRLKNIQTFEQHSSELNIDMKEILNPTKRIDYRHYVIYENDKYVRTETLSLKHFCWESEPEKLIDLHTIKWELLDGDGSSVEYFSLGSGWSKNGKLNKSNPVPEIEKCFKGNIGKDLLYF